VARLRVALSRDSSSVDHRNRWILRAIGAGARRVVTVIGLLLLIPAGWELIKFATGASNTTMPHVSDIVAHLRTTTSHGNTFAGFLFENAYVTFKASAVGLAIGAVTGLTTGVLIVRSRLVGKGLLPLVVASQTVPIVAIAPALVLWLGTSWTTKVVIAGYLTYFPLTIATARGIQAVSNDSLALMRTYSATRREVLLKIQLPAAMPMIFVGLETAAAFSVIGTIVGEMPVGSPKGLGLVILTTWQYYNFQPEALYGAALAACALGGLMVGFVRVLGRVTLKDRRMGAVL